VIRTADTTLDVVNHTADVTYRVWDIEKGAVRSDATENHRLRYFFPKEFSLFLDNTGFELKSISAFPSLDQVPDDKTWNAFVVALAV
jgi:hypothetical protein